MYENKRAWGTAPLRVSLSYQTISGKRRQADTLRQKISHDLFLSTGVQN